ncbi:hypothetical protein CANARDRAFT_8712 [[Candida] arabinofermentans NRRL YB-2248]|uniref:serine--tRNA ligase n=1 Tax=[Candida] arabinofermentans NRRL YB-2248 TaxID=983967 RepID=A0A1E4SXY1_9ASCO|nr:hypothetical protein CANARDRAFT_8712 [[Candida] arabinofermentans NRRL YB-2248]
MFTVSRSHGSKHFWYISRRHQSSTILRTSNTLKKPQFDLKHYNESVSEYIDICKKRNVQYPLGSDFTSLYQTFVETQKSVLDLKKEINYTQHALTTLKVKQKKENVDNANDQTELIHKISSLKPKLKDLEENCTEIENEITTKVDQLPNLIHPSVQSKQILLQYLNPIPELLAPNLIEDYPLSADPQFDHKGIMESMGLVEFNQATKISGRGWYYLLGDAALLEQALIQYSLKLARKAGFKMILPPSIVKTDVTSACGFKPRDTNNERQVYELTHDQLCLTGTAEIPLAALQINKEFSVSDLPHRLVGLSRSYRAEAGSAGRDTRGLYRVHEFTKVELFSWTHGSEEESEKEFEKIVNFQKQFVESLGLTARVLVMPYDDLGAPAYKKIDIEVLMPGRGTWGEVSSTSNCLDYQSRRLTTKFRDPISKKLKYTHTLNGTACAIPRVIVAIVENFYDPNSNSILIPEVLRPYMDDKERIYKQ